MRLLWLNFLITDWQWLHTINTKVPPTGTFFLGISIIKEALKNV